MSWHYHDRFEIAARASPDKVAVVVGCARATYREISDFSSQVANALRARGVRPGDRVATYAQTSVHAVAAALGILKAGCVIVTVHHTFGRDKLRYQIDESGACALVVGNALAGPNALADTPTLRLIIAIDVPVRPGPRVLAADDVMRFPIGITPDHDTSADRLAAIFYTSGSTSRPKGVAINQSNMTAAVDSVTSYLGLTARDVVLSYSHMGSDYGFYNLTMPLLVGASSVMEAAIPADPQRIVDVVNRHGVTALHVLPPLLAKLVQLPEPHAHQIPSVRYISSTGQPLPTQHILMVKAHFPAVDILSMYGMNECMRIAYLSPKEIDRRPTSVGKAIPGVRTYLVDDADELITKPHITGELAVAGDLLMQGYWRNPKLTRRSVRPLFGEDRVFFTGDLFMTDEDGFLHFVARRDDVFGRFLFKVNPREIEQVLTEHPAVAEAVVVAVPDDAAGHVPTAFVVLKDGPGPTPGQVVEYCAERLDWHMVPVDVEFLAELPRTWTGKTAARWTQLNPTEGEDLHDVHQ